MNIGQLRQRYQFLREFTDEEVAGYLIAAHGINDRRDPRYDALEKQLLGYERTTGEKLKDTGLGLVQGALGVAETGVVLQGAMIPFVRAFDNPVVNTVRGWNEALNQYKSQGLRNQEVGAEVAGDIATRQAAAEGAGTMGRIAAGAKAQLGAYVDNPGLAVQDTVQALPSLVAGGFAGRAVQGGLRAVGAGVQAATRGGVVAGVGTSGALQGGDVASDTYERMRQAGADYDTAASEAAVAGAKGAVASVALTALPGGATIERSLIRGAAGRGGALGAVRGGAAELVTEAGEEGYGQFAGNQAVRTVDPNVDLAEGVGQAAARGGVGAFAPGAVAGLRRSNPAPAAAPAPRTETGEIDLTGSQRYAELDTPTYARRGLDPTFERSSPWMPPQEIEAQGRTRTLATQPGMDGQGAVPGYLQNDQNIPAFLRAEPTMADIAGPAVNPVQRADATMADLYVEQPANPFDTPQQRQTPPMHPGPLNAQNPFEGDLPTRQDATLPPAAGPLDRAPNWQTAPGAAPELGNAVEFTRDVDTGNLALQQLGQAPAAPAPAADAKPTVGQVLVALERANQALGGNVIRKDGQVSQASGTAKLRSILESKAPVEVMRRVYEDGKNPRDELLDVWHKELTGQTIAEFKAAAPTAAPAASVAASEAAVAAPATPAPAQAPVTAPVQGAQVQQLAPKRPTLAERKISARVDGAGAAMDGAGLRANPHKPGTTAYKEWIEGYDEVKARAEAAKENPIAKKLVETVENTKDETLYDESLYALYKLAAKGDVAAFNYFQNNGYYDDISADGKKLKPAQAAEMRKLRERWNQEQGERRGKKFGATKAIQLRNPDNSVATPMDTESLSEDAVDVANDLATGASNKEDREVAKRIKQHLFGVRVVVARNGVEVPEQIADYFHRTSGTASGATAFDAETGDVTVYIDPRTGSREDVVLHELVHAATMRAIDHPSNGALRQDLEAVRKAVLNALSREKYNLAHDPKRTELGRFFSEVVVDGHELLAYAFSSPTLRDFLRGLDSNGNPLPRTVAEARRVMPNLWQRVVNVVRRAFGLPPAYAPRMEIIVEGGQVITGPDTITMHQRLDELLGRTLSGPSGGGQPTTKPHTDNVAVKPIAEGARALTATLKAQLKGEELNEPLLNMMTLRQIDEQFGKKLPALRDWVNVVMERSTNASKLAAEADRVALQWQQDVPRNEMKPLAEILLRASNAELQLDNTNAKYLESLGAEERAEHAALRAKLEALSPAAQQARKDALAVLKRQWDYTHQALEKFITLTVSDPDLRSKRLHDLKQEFGRNRGDYFPLSRFGDRVVIARGAAKDGRDIVTFHESAKAVEDEVRKLKDSGVKPDSIIVTMSTEYDPRKTPGTGFVRELHAMIDTVADGDEARQLHQSLQQLYLKSLPELSGAKHMVRRENIEGYSQDALRVFADAVTRGSRYASHLEFGPAVHAAMEAAETQSRSSDRRTAAVVIGRKDGQQPVVKVVGTGTERLQAVEKMAEDGYAVEFFSAHPETVAERLAGALEAATPEELAGYVRQVRDAVKKSTEGVEDLRAAKQLYNYMVRSQKADLDPNPGKVVEIAGQLGYAWYLGFSPAFWAMNTLQNPMVGIPHLGGKYGVTKASTEWMRAAKWFATVRIGKRLASDSEPFSVEWLRDQVKAGELKGINKQELDMLQRLEDRQVLDFTQAMDLSRIGAASNSKWYKAMRLAAAGAHHTEVFNRVSFALAAYRLAMKSRSDITHEEAVRAAERDVASAHFDYSYANKPLWMGKSTPALRLVFMFQQYRQHMLYWWANTIKDATKGMTPEDRSRARKSALLMGTTQLLFAGTMGLPFVGAVGALANMLGGGGEDGEEPFDFERWMREAALGMTGSEEGADLMTKGIFAALGADISKRIGQGDLLPLLNAGSARFERNFDDKARAYLFDVLGPLGSIALGAARATEAFSSGDYLKGLAAATPKAVSDILKSYQQASEGLKDKRGMQLASEEAFDGWDAALQAAGVTPTAVSNVKAARGAVLDIQNTFRDQSKRLTGEFIEAWMRNDHEGVTEALADIQRYNANIAKGRTPARELFITPDRIRSAIVDRQRRAMLLALTGGLADTRQQLLIATRVSGLYDLEGRDVRLDAAGLPSFSVGD